MDSIITVSAFLVAMTVGIVQVVKMTGMPSRFAPLLSLLVGIALQLIAIPASVSFHVALLSGIAVGLSACGLYSGVKATITPTVQE